MIRLLLLLSLSLLLAACKEKPAELASYDDKSGNLLGFWEFEHQEVTRYDAQGKVVSRRSEPRQTGVFGLRAVAFTDSTVQIDQHGLRATIGYIRHGDTLRVPGTYTWVIQRLTAKELVYHENLRFYLPAPSTQYQRQETLYYFVR